MSNCETFECTDDTPCVEVLRNLYSIYLNVISGSRARVRMGTRWSEYHPGNPDAVKLLYMQIYAQCQDPAKCTLPDLSVSAIRRGPPVGGCYPPPYPHRGGRY